VDAAKQFLEEIKMEEEKKERSTADDDIDDSDTEKKSDQCAVVSVMGVTEDEQPDPNEGPVTCNEVVEDKHHDLNENTVTCNEVIENKQPDLNEGSVSYEDKLHDPIESTVTNKESSTADGAITEPSNGELTKEQENVRGREKSEAPTNFLSGMVYCPQLLVITILFCSTR